jgi:hypothetical protein
MHFFVYKEICILNISCSEYSLYGLDIFQIILIEYDRKYINYLHFKDDKVS